MVTIQGGSAWQIAGKLDKQKNENFSFITSTTADSPKLLKNNFISELDLTSFKFSAIKSFFQKFRRIGKVPLENSMWVN